jgi:triacylglycerol lipase
MMPTRRSPHARVHLVLVPGFAGFDALGQLEYYAGVTPQFADWKTAGQHREHAVLHYFDNFPTAAVATRATRLRNYLAKRIARGEFLPGDTLALVGHSTGGLDIRYLLWELAHSVDKSYPVDGTTVHAKTILASIRRVVFLSVPQWGTNIANWVRDHAAGRALVIAELRASVTASQVPLVDKIQEWISDWAAAATRLDLVYAIQDAFDEAEARLDNDPTRTALAQEAASEIALWLRHIATDFHVIKDLSSQPPNGTNPSPAGSSSQHREVEDASPAHFGPTKRAHEVAIWKKFHIQTRSYSTLGRRPFRFKEGGPAPRWDLLNPFGYPECTPRADQNGRTDIIYRYCYRACAGGPFTYPDSTKVPVPVPFAINAKHPRPIELWDNDGIVNTASMLWPEGEKTLLVDGDHMDIVGHYHLVRAPRNQLTRKYDAYDLLKSHSGFDSDAFRKVWDDVFGFCIS